jgi:hypothetical protein
MDGHGGYFTSSSSILSLRRKRESGIYSEIFMNHLEIDEWKITIRLEYLALR